MAPYVPGPRYPSASGAWQRAEHLQSQARSYPAVKPDKFVASASTSKHLSRQAPAAVGH